MRALTIQDGELVVAERPVPQLAAENDVLVRVHGAGLNRADLLQRIGLYPAPPGWPADIPGMEFAGVVEQVSTNVHALKPGDAVMGIVGGGAQAEYVLTTQGCCARVPSSIDLVTAGGIPEAFITAHDALATQGEMHPGDRILVTAVGSGVGTAALQIAESLGATVVGTARTADKIERCRALGLAHGIVVTGDVDPVALADEVVAAAGGGIDVFAELVGGRYVEADVRAAADNARIVVIGTLAGGTAQLDLLTLMRKRAIIRGTTLRGRSEMEKAGATHAFAGQVIPLLAAGTIMPIVDAVLSLEDATKAYDLLASDSTFGKVILSLV
jgi:NADPH:quinone reductase-like Zn-dependent oxidoreductase